MTVILAGAGLCGFGPLAHAQSTSINGKIAYMVCGLPSEIPFVDRQCDIAVMDPDGTNQTNITNSPDINEANPAWSPDGNTIAYFEGSNGLFNLRGMGADGSNPSPIITTTSTYPYGPVPTWSPGGTQIAFVRNNPGSPVSVQADIVVIDVTTRAETTVTGRVSFGNALVDADEVEPAWSPDGGKIAFAGVRLEQYPDPITGAPSEAAQWEIVTVNPDGTGEKIVSAGDRNTDRALFLEEDRAPAWSPDGSKIVFMSQDQVPSCCGPWQIWAVNRNGTGATNLTNDPTVSDLWPRWSPDGTQILFSRYDGAGGFDLYTMPAPATLPLAAPLAAAQPSTTTTLAAASGTLTRLTNVGNASNPDWGRTPGTPTADAFKLYVSVMTQGRGAGGSVNSDPAGIRCGHDCTQAYAKGTLVQLKASPRKGSALSWSGACSGTNAVCRVTMDDVKSVKATFTR